MPTQDEIFIFRSCPIDQFKRFVESIKVERRNIRIVVLTNRDGEVLRENRSIDKLIIYPFKKFRFLLFLWIILKEKLKTHYESIIIPFNEYTWKNYSNVILCATLLRGSVIGLNIEGRKIPFCKGDTFCILLKLLYGYLLFPLKILILLFAMIVSLKSYPRVRL